MYCERDLPLFHTQVYTDIEVDIVGGSFMGARLKRLKTLVPMTEASAARTSAPIPHCLSDNIAYVAGDYQHYAGKDERCAICSRLYYERLSDWAGSECATDRLRVLYGYLSRHTLFKDLLSVGVFKNVERRHVGRLWVRFVTDGVAAWEDRELWESHIAYQRSLYKPDSVCAVTGETVTAAALHPKRITGAASSAKLITAGKLPIGCEVTWKAHAVLRRLLCEAGETIGSKSFVAWDENGRAVPIFSRLAEEYEGRITVLVLHETDRGNLAVTLYGQTSGRQLSLSCKQELFRSGDRNLDTAANAAERMLRCIIRE